ncbi:MULTISPECIES: FadR/GntR family transcriptional regulator [Kocuria]|uniref:FadR/GntR family transcriptional regulator n=1 Tax=Kocuria TaxID=57493 RepID=UPI001E4D3946|nr:FadR/GntR family transcriptional regulator [Kocuria rosea]MCC5782457.1 GntR family transcriptional regulator [Kocuria sp. CCUG 69068]WIG17500.1 FadR/GntR family transcriptional regulator [Kocuria rosea]
MARPSLVDQVADALLDRIVAGDLPPGSVVPGEIDLSAEHQVSRMTVREAVRTLGAQRILRVERGRGTFVNPVSQWASLDAVIRAVSEGQDDAAAAVQLIELRRFLETGACELAAGRLSAAELAGLARDADAMEDAHRAQDVAAFVRADLRFHERILQASGNVFIAVLFAPLHRVLEERRAQTSRVPEIQAHAIDEHRRIVAALGSADPVRARQAMDEHMQQTLADLKTYVLGDLSPADR